MVPDTTGARNQARFLTNPVYVSSAGREGGYEHPHSIVLHDLAEMNRTHVWVNEELRLKYRFELG